MYKIQETITMSDPSNQTILALAWALTDRGASTFKCFDEAIFTKSCGIFITALGYVENRNTIIIRPVFY